MRIDPQPTYLVHSTGCTGVQHLALAYNISHGLKTRHYILTRGCKSDCRSFAQKETKRSAQGSTARRHVVQRRVSAQGQGEGQAAKTHIIEYIVIYYISYILRVILDYTIQYKQRGRGAPRSPRDAFRGRRLRPSEGPRRGTLGPRGPGDFPGDRAAMGPGLSRRAAEARRWGVRAATTTLWGRLLWRP